MSDDGSGPLRLFVAIELSDSWRTHLAALRSESWSAGSERYRWVSPELLHVTLLFLGAQPSPLLPEIRAAMEAAAAMAAPFTLRLGGVGSFGGRRGHVLWVAIEDGSGLRRIRTRLDEQLDRLGLAYDRKPLRPHVTLARARGSGRGIPAPLAYPDDALSRPGPQAVEHIALVRSHLGHTGPRYTVLARAPLAGGATRTERASL